MQNNEIISKKGAPFHTLKPAAQELMLDLSIRGQKLNGVSIHRELVDRHGNEAPHLRTVQNWAKDYRKSFPSVRSEDASRFEWVAWRDNEQSPDEVAYLKLMDIVGQTLIGEKLDETQAKWALKLRDVLDGADPVFSWVIIAQYAWRGNLVSHFGPGEITEDLDAVIATCAWDPDNHELYESWVESKMVKTLFLYPGDGTLDLPDLVAYTFGVIGLDHRLTLDWKEFLISKTKNIT